jgi:hypothetical protein
MALPTALQKDIPTLERPPYPAAFKKNIPAPETAASTWELGTVPAGVELVGNENRINPANNPLHDVLVELENDSENELTTAIFSTSNVQLANSAAKKLHSDLPPSKEEPSTCAKINKGIDIGAAVSCGIGALCGLGLVGVAIKLIIDQPDMGNKNPGAAGFTAGLFIIGAAGAACGSVMLVQWVRHVILK